MHPLQRSSILVVNSIDTSLEEILAFYPSHFTRVIKNSEKNEFQIVDAQNAIKEAYIATNETKYIFLCGATFRSEAQNALLKVLEEPPLNIVFIILVESKSSILPTIHSRLLYKNLKQSVLEEDIDLDLKYLDLKTLYNFVKENQRISKDEAIKLVGKLVLKINKDKISLNEDELESFSKAITLLNLNSRPAPILAYLLLTILEKERQ
ncbi:MULTISPECIES: DNA polymerase III subunit delta' [Aliarcobacter]|uniref:DNA polymerase III, delta prime subunit n=2 Tax=Aliarcobacter skirrowii TaxID=28200 RepID=A0AAD0SLC2_9BACT|nr:DNA polymerase III subunit delta' [Aliarcobacter skirrowii]AXX84862.1 DNA polymerase III, delta prime subunit [Aliarcobacter skirrowii CCUG 10374]MDD2508799.1 DNA polymerase III subunit delta' [Aliarcobacter skirrowii]MDD3025354.1 DNA polymerase III subunit delta' [Aliarcobacter skirrowii]MDD3497355.1 DNA polymerase III subunit delta' [Aliarcobacter skirrowii]MDX4027656.1 DNA polymerase III subunit delta' [Aliarcobacter skirrowii]